MVNHYLGKANNTVFYKMTKDIALTKPWKSIGKYDFTEKTDIGHFYGNFDGAEVEDCYSTGSVVLDKPSASMGAFVGRLCSTIQNCYASGIIKVGNSTANNLVGSVNREEFIIACGSFGGKPLFVEFGSDGDFKSTSLTKNNSVDKTTYTKRDWNFVMVWKMPPSGAKYNLPILQTIDEAVQKDLAMPE